MPLWVPSLVCHGEQHLFPRPSIATWCFSNLSVFKSLGTDLCMAEAVSQEGLIKGFYAGTWVCAVRMVLAAEVQLAV